MLLVVFVVTDRERRAFGWIPSFPSAPRIFPRARIRSRRDRSNVGDTTPRARRGDAERRAETHPVMAEEENCAVADMAGAKRRRVRTRSAASASASASASAGTTTDRPLDRPTRARDLALARGWQPFVRCTNVSTTSACGGARSRRSMSHPSLLGYTVHTRVHIHAINTKRETHISATTELRPHRVAWRDRTGEMSHHPSTRETTATTTTTNAR